MIDFSNDTAQALLQQMLEQVPDTFDKRDTAPIPTALGPAAWALEGFYLVLNQVQQSAFIQTAGGQSLDNLAVIGSISRYPASPAVRLGRFNVPVPIGSRFSTVNGADSMDFTVTEADGTDSGSYLYKLTADTPGTAGNDYSGPLLPITVIPGLTSAEMTDILTPGDDTETDGALRARLITALNDRPFGGNIASYRDAILAIDGVGAVQVYPTWNGGGTVKCSVLGSDWLPASQDLVNAVQTAADPPPNQGLGLGFAPIGAQVTVTAPEAVAINIGADLTLTPGTTLAQVQPQAEAALAAYLLELRKSWADNVGVSGLEYACGVYLARITAALVGITGVVNAANVTINGSAADLTLTETSALQQVPTPGEVSLSV